VKAPGSARGMQSRSHPGCERR